MPSIAALSPLVFQLDLTRPGQHRIGVVLEVDLATLPQSAARGLAFFLPVWTPGSYLIREHARHIEGFSAADSCSGAPITWRKTAKNRFFVEVTERCERLRIAYTVYGHELTVRTADFTDAHAFWNGACVFLWPVGAEQLLSTVEIDLPPGWQLVSQLPSTTVNGRVRFEAHGLDQLLDAPCLAGELDVRTFDVLGKQHRLTLEGLDGVPVPESLIPDITRVIECAAAIFSGELPYESYRFLALFADGGRGGLEHADSSTLLAPRTTFCPRKDYDDFLGLVAHEHFHVWNGKRMRPAELWRFDYETENYTSLLWVVEGFTAYYDDHLCLRAGVLTSKRYLELLAENIATARKTPGRLIHPLSAASTDAWIKLYRPDENSRNSTQSYYTHGALAAMCFDLHIRAATGGARSLDDALASLYATTFLDGRGYEDHDVVASLSAAAGEDLTPLKNRLIDGPFDPDFDAFLAPFGLRLIHTGTERPHFGIQFQGDELRIASVLAGSPAMAGGLSPGDEIIAVSGLRVNRANWSAVVQSLWAPGRSLEFLLARRGRVVERPVTPTPTPSDALRVENVSRASTEQIALRRSWLFEGAATGPRLAKSGHP